MRPTLPALVLQFMRDDGPGHLGAWARRRGLALDVAHATVGGGFPESIDGYGAMVMLGGAMSANDELPFLRAAENLIAQCLDAEVPVIGHCLGGQLMARTLGAAVHASPAPEIGWHAMECLGGDATSAWFGPNASHAVFHWHYDAFDLPRGATALARSAACPVQAFSVGPHLAMQFHVEIDAAKIELWLSQPEERYAIEQRRHPTVQRADTIHQLTRRCLGAHQALADRVYDRWLSGHRALSQ